MSFLFNKNLMSNVVFITSLLYGCFAYALPKVKPEIDLKNTEAKAIVAKIAYEQCGMNEQYNLRNSKSRFHNSDNKHAEHAELDYELITEHFHIYYTLTGEDAVDPQDSDLNNIPDYIDHIAKGAEYGWQLLVEDMGWLQPPGVNEEGLLRLEVKMLDGYFGLAYLDHFEIDSNSFGLKLVPSALEAVVVHEFVHECQFAYSTSLSYLDEAVATYYQVEWTPWGDSFLGKIHKDILTAMRLDRSFLDLYYVEQGGYPSVLFFQYLEDRLMQLYGYDKFTASLFNRTLNEHRRNESLGFVKSMLATFDDYGLLFDEEITEYTIWNVLLGTYAQDGYGYNNAKEIKTQYGSIRPIALYDVSAHIDGDGSFDVDTIGEDVPNLDQTGSACIKFENMPVTQSYIDVVVSINPTSYDNPYGPVFTGGFVAIDAQGKAFIDFVKKADSANPTTSWRIDNIQDYEDIFFCTTNPNNSSISSSSTSVDWSYHATLTNL